MPKAKRTSTQKWTVTSSNQPSAELLARVLAPVVVKLARQAQQEVKS